MESQPQNPEFRNNGETLTYGVQGIYDFHQCLLIWQSSSNSFMKSDCLRQYKTYNI